MNSLEFIKKNVKQWPSGKCKFMTVTSAGRVVCGDEMFKDLDISISTKEWSSDYYDRIIWTRAEFEAYKVGESK